MSIFRRAVVQGLGVGTVVAIVSPSAAFGQSATPGDPFSGRTISSIDVRIVNPSSDSGLNERVAGNVRRLLALFPGETYSRERIGFAFGLASRAGDVGKIEQEVSSAADGGVDLVITVQLQPGAEAGQKRGALATGKGFPLLYDDGDTRLNAEINLLGLYYGNGNAWFARPDLMVSGNPLVVGEPSGKGWDHWVEGYAEVGVNVLTRLSSNAYAYGALSDLVTGSVGQELFTDKSRLHNGIEKAYAGIIVGKTTAKGDRIAFNFNAGRQRFTLANGFLIANTAANGGERGALQANARWAADLLVNGQFFWNGLKIEGFLVDPDELPILDTKTRIVGVNAEYRPVPGLMVGGALLKVPRSTYAYFGPAGQVGTRDGLRLWDLRATWTPRLPNRSGPFFGAEFAQQTNSKFPMRARAGWVEAGYSWPKAKWSPSIAYRYSRFSGDDPDTERFERWDPLLSGGSGEQWVQGANIFKVVQDSNSVAHRFQARVKPSPKWELVPQFWLIRADSLANIGGNPALQFLSSKKYANEGVLTIKHFASRNIYIHGQLAFTWPGKSVKDALSNTQKDWSSAMIFVRYAF